MTGEQCRKCRRDSCEGYSDCTMVAIIYLLNPIDINKNVTLEQCDTSSGKKHYVTYAVYTG